MELTREKVEAIATFNFKDTCEKCRSGKEMLATALLAEMDKPKVWDGAPEWANVAEITWRDKANTKHKALLKPYTRELPKSRERQIAEKVGNNIANKYEWNRDARTLMINTCESAILKYKAELEDGR